MNDSVNKNDPHVRQAIWEIHKEKCFYSNEVINIEEMEIDHILPESLKNDSAKRNEVYKIFELPEDFQLDSLENYLPCKRSDNRLKSDTILPGTGIYLTRAKKLAPQIKAKIKFLKKQKDRGRALTHLKAQTSSNDSQNIERIHDHLADENSPFEEKKEIFSSDDPFYINQKKDVAIHAYLPAYSNKGKGSCLIIFRSLKIRSCMITFNNKDILNIFCEGRSIKIEDRKFVVCPDLHHSEFYYIQLGNVRFKLAKSTLKNLVDIVDDFSIEYLTYLENYEKIQMASLFDLSKFDGQYRLLKINSWFWHNFQYFSKSFHYENGDSKWHIFDCSSNSIFIESRNKNNETQSYTRAILSTEIDYQGQLWLTWQNSYHNHYSRTAPSFRKDSYWSAMHTYDWLLHDFLPYCFYFFSLREPGILNGLRYHLSKFTFYENKFYSQFLKSFKISNFQIYDCKTKDTYIFINHIDSVSKLQKAAEKLQCFFSISKYISINEKTISDLLLSLELCITDSQIKDLNYIVEELDFVNSSNKTEIVIAVKKYRANLSQKQTNIHQIDYIFRAIIWVLEDCHLSLSKVKYILNLWKPLLHIHKERLLINKYIEGDS